jgi:hypothetical protein
LLLLILPLLNTTSIKKILFFPFSKDHSPGSSAEDDACPVCGVNPITIAFIAIPCEHKYCYYCLRTRCSASSSFHCLRCNAQVMAMKRNSPQVNSIGDDSWNSSVKMHIYLFDFCPLVICKVVHEQAAKSMSVGFYISISALSCWSLLRWGILMGKDVLY